MYSIHYARGAEEDLRALRPYERKQVFDEVTKQLKNEPTVLTKRRKPLEGLMPPWDAVPPIWQLRIDDYRVFYDVDEERKKVMVRAVRYKGTQRTEEIL